jgi:hypothetical protein
VRLYLEACLVSHPVSSGSLEEVGVQLWILYTHHTPASVGSRTGTESTGTSVAVAQRNSRARGEEEDTLFDIVP